MRAHHFPIPTIYPAREVGNYFLQYNATIDPKDKRVEGSVAPSTRLPYNLGVFGQLGLPAQSETLNEIPIYSRILLLQVVQLPAALTN